MKRATRSAPSLDRLGRYEAHQPRYKKWTYHPGYRCMAIRVPAPLMTLVHERCYQMTTTIQDYVAGLIEDDIRTYHISEDTDGLGYCMTPEQIQERTDIT